MYYKRLKTVTVLFFFTKQPYASPHRLLDSLVVECWHRPRRADKSRKLKKIYKKMPVPEYADRHH